MLPPSPMAENRQKPLQEGIRSLRARWTRVAICRFGLQASFYLLLVAAMALALFPELGRVELAVGLILLAALTGGTATWIQRPTATRLAKDFDDATGQADRVSSAIGLIEQEGPMVDALQAEAATVAASIDPGEVYPMALPREGRWLPLPALLVALALVLPMFFAEQAKGDPEFEASLEDRIEELEELLSEERKKEKSPLREKLLEELEELKAELDGEKVDRKDTMAEVAKLREQLEDERERETKKLEDLKKLLKGLQQQAGQENMARMVEQGQFQDALQKLREKIEELQKKIEELKEEGASEEEIKPLEEELARLKEIEAKLMEMLQLNFDLNMLGTAIDFLAHWDGELGDLADLDDVEMVEPGEP